MPRRGKDSKEIHELCFVKVVISGRPMMLPRSLERTETQRSPSQQALLVVSPDGRIQFATARATHWLKDFSFSPSDRLPQALAGWLDQVISSSRPSRFILDRSGTQLCFQMIYREPKSVCLLLEPRAKSVAPRSSRALLTQRQIEVLSWVARGKNECRDREDPELENGNDRQISRTNFPEARCREPHRGRQLCSRHELGELAAISCLGATPRSAPRALRWRSSLAEGIRPSVLPNRSFHPPRKRPAICGA